MNRALEQMMRLRRQAEGRRPDGRWDMMIQGIPENWARGPIPPSFAAQLREEQDQRLTFFSPPAFDPNELVELPTSWKPDSELDPIPQSDFFAAGNKIRPWAHVRVPSYVEIAEWESPSYDEFLSGKIYMGQLVGQYQGKQIPIDIIPLIPEVEYTTYGTLNRLSEGAISSFPAQDGYLYD